MSDKTRAEFEYWASDDGENPAAVERAGHGYKLAQIQTYWQAWLAAKEKYDPRWLPIESAPKDGTEVLVYDPRETLHPTAAKYDTREYFEAEYGDPNYMEEGWRGSLGYPSDFHEDVIYPTHWMPLPSEPSTQGGGE